MDKNYIEREVERRSNWLKIGWGSVLLFFIFAIGEFIVGYHDNNAGLFIFGGMFTIFGIVGLFIVLSNKQKKDLEPYKQMLRDKITRQEELRDAQLNVLKKGHKEVHLKGKMRKL